MTKEQIEVLKLLYEEDLKDPSSAISIAIQESIRSPFWEALLKYMKEVHEDIP